MDVSHFLTPGFHPAFLEVLRYLAKQKSEVKQTRAFKRFVRDYGTHYVSSAYMGAKIATVTFYDGPERLKFGKQRLLNCSETFARDQFDLKLEFDKSDDEDKDEDDDDYDADVVEDDEDDDIDYDDLFGKRSLQ